MAKPVTLPQNAGEFSKLPPQGYAIDVPDMTAAEVNAIVNGDVWKETWESRDGYWSALEVRGYWRRRHPEKYQARIWQEKKEQRALEQRALMSAYKVVRKEERRLSFPRWKKWFAQERAKAVAARANP